MGAWTAQRAALRDLLDASGIHAFTTVPKHVTPPCVFVAPGEPYVSRSNATFGGEWVNLSVVAVAAAGASDVQAEALDDLIELVMNTIESDGTFTLGDVSRPGQLSINGQSHLAADVAVTIEIHR